MSIIMVRDPVLVAEENKAILDSIEQLRSLDIQGDIQDKFAQAHAEWICRMYGLPLGTYENEADIQADMPSDCEPSPPVIETKPAEEIPLAETDRMWDALKEIAGG